MVFSYEIFLILIVLLPLMINGTPCPNDCSSHGRCTDNRDCECFKGYMGGDCSLRTCPEGIAWADLPIATDKAHNLAECSNMGSCDRSTGTCLCRTGYDGQACDRMQCPSQCNSRGKCISLLYKAQTKDIGEGYPGLPSISRVYEYKDAWDAEKIFGCSCDDNFHGPDCSLMHCPTGDDPLTLLQKNEIQDGRCKATSGDFTMSFRGATTTPINYDATGAQIKAALEALKTITEVDVGVDTSKPCLANGGTFQITFTQEFGNVPMLVPDGTGLRHTTSTSSISVAERQPGTKEDEFCSNRGICDTTTGLCMCSINYASSDGRRQEGIRGDCGFDTVSIRVCPGLISCSGHGICDTASGTFRCACAAGWQGADCSERVCPKDMSWYSLPSADEVMHIYEQVECSDMGTCDRTTGRCLCLPGFTGAACNRMSCPGSIPCSGHGNCYTMSDMAEFATVNGELAGYTYGVIPNNPLTWDAEHIQGCVCNENYHGYDCSKMTCLSGDNPDSIGQLDEVQEIHCKAPDLDPALDAATKQSQAVKLTIEYKNEITASLYQYATADEVRDALQVLNGIREVEVTATSNTTLCDSTLTGSSFRVKFLTEHGDLPPLRLKSVLSEDSVFRNSTLTTTELIKGTKEWVTCSDRGICDESTGKCSCFKGYASSDAKGGPGVYPDCGHVEKIVIDLS